MVFYPKDPRIYNILERLTRENGACTDGNIARKMGKCPQIKAIREKNMMYIGMDRRKNKSLIVVVKQVRKKGKGFIF